MSFSLSKHNHLHFWSPSSSLISKLNDLFVLQGFCKSVAEHRSVSTPRGVLDARTTLDQRCGWDGNPPDCIMSVLRLRSQRRIRNVLLSSGFGFMDFLGRNTYSFQVNSIWISPPNKQGWEATQVNIAEWLRRRLSHCAQVFIDSL